MRIKHLLVLCSIMLLLMVSATAEKTPRTISVTGTSLTKVPPDVIVWSISARDTNKALLTAKRSNDEKLKAIMALLKELEVSAEDIKTGSLSIRKEYNRDDRGNTTDFKHFSVSRHVTTSQRDMQRFDEFLEKLVSAAEVEVSFRLDSSDVTDARYQNRLKAVGLARKKAQDMLDMLGARLGKVISVDEHPQSPYGSRIMDINNPAFSYGRRAEVSDDSISGTFVPGAIDIRTTVYITFEID